MSEWKETSLDEIAIINPKEVLKKGEMAKKVSMESINSFEKKIRSWTLDSFHGGMKFRNGDTLIARITPCLENGKTAYVDILDDKEVGFGSTEFIVIREKTGLSDSQFLYYLAISQDFRDVAILSMTGSSGRQRVQTDVIKFRPFPLPPLPEQRAIASVLSSLDDKIDLLHRQNRTLEAMAETLFRQWFVEEAVNISGKQMHIGDFVESVSITHKFLLDTVVFLNTSDVYLGDVTNHEFSNVRSLPGQAKKTIQKDDILFSEIRPANGRYAYIDFDAENYVVSTKLMVLRSKKQMSQALIYFYLTNPQTLDWLQLLAESRSGTFPQITFDHIKELTINIPSETVLKFSTEFCEKSLKKIKMNNSQIRTLESLRDTLLPKLMSGEVRVA